MKAASDDRSIRVLVVDDSAPVRHRLMAALDERDRVEVEGAATCHDALAHLAGEHFDAIIIDLSLPDGSGLDVLRAAKKNDPRCLAVILTSMASQEAANACRALGANHFFDKTTHFDEAIAIVSSAPARGA